MAGPMDAILAFHNAFRRDMTTIDGAALVWARDGQDPGPALERFRFFNEALVWHATGEERAIFPALEEVAPSVAEAYERDHRALDAAYEVLSEAVAAGDSLETARATAAYKFHLDLHLDKEDSHLYRLIRKRVSEADQYQAIGIMAASVPPEKFPEAIAWLFPLLGPVDRDNLTSVWQKLMPPEVFSGVKQLIRGAVGND